jgi:hypothetical protein
VTTRHGFFILSMAAALKKTEKANPDHELPLTLSTVALP